MSAKYLKRIGISVGALTGVVLALCFVTPRVQADQWDKMTLLTVDQPTQIADTYLEPGTYMLKLANSQSDRNIVQIFNRDRSHLINTVIAIPSYRIVPKGDTTISYWETPPGTARAVRDWFYPGDYDGQEFRYPTQLRQIAAVTPLPALAPQPPPPVATEPETPAPQALEQTPPAPQEPVEVAQNTPPPAPQEPVEIAQNNPPPAPPATPQPPSAEQTLPKTGSPYPLFGLGGLFALGLYGVLRLKPIA